MSNNEDFSQTLADYFSVDGPHDADKTREAGRAIYELIRYLNHATQRDHVLQYAATADSIISSIGGAIVLMDQLLQQIDKAVGSYTSDPTIYDDRNVDTATGQATAHKATLALTRAQHAAQTLAYELNQVGSFLGHLGHRTPE